MITAHMVEFITTGGFGPVCLGLTRADIYQLCGPPDRMGGTSRRYPVPCIWQYGDIEIHFEQDGDRAVRLYLDDFAVPSGGNAIVLDPWIVYGGLTRSAFEDALRSMDVDYRLKDAPWAQGAVTVIQVPTGIKFWFQDIVTGSDEQTGLSAISLER